MWVNVVQDEPEVVNTYSLSTPRTDLDTRSSARVLQQRPLSSAASDYSFPSLNSSRPGSGFVPARETIAEADLSLDPRAGLL